MKGHSLLVLAALCIFLVVAVLCNMTMGAKIETYRAGLCKMGEDDTVLAPMSYVGCIEECRARSQCLSINVYPRMNLCRLNFNASLALKKCDFYAYSEKSSWIKKTKDGCDRINCLKNQKCKTTEIGAVCVNSECRRVTHIQNGFVYGNDVRKGMRIAFGCRRGYSLIGRSPVTCMDDGFWSDDIPVCSGGTATKTLNSSSTMTTSTTTQKSTSNIHDNSNDESTTHSPKTWQNGSVDANQGLAENDHNVTADTLSVTPYNQSTSSEATKKETDSVPSSTPVSTLTWTENTGIKKDFMFNTNSETGLNGSYQSSITSHGDDAVHIADTTTQNIQTQDSFVPEATQSFDLDQESTIVSTSSGDLTGDISDSIETDTQTWSSPELLQTDKKTSTALVDSDGISIQQTSTTVLPTSTETALASTTTATTTPRTSTALSTISTTFRVLQYGDSCSMPSNCDSYQWECRDDLCQCFGMRVFDPNRNICVPVCSRYGKTYEKYSDHTFTDDGMIQELHTNGPPECFHVCETMAHCNAVWVHELVPSPAILCRLYSIPLQEISLNHEVRFHVYLRNCE